MGKLNRIHDSFFKKVFGDKKNIVDFFKIALPEKIYNEINLKEIDIDSSNYIDDSLKEHLSDIVIKTKLKSKNKKSEIDSDIYILFEHKSYEDKKVLFQVLKYMYMIWDSDIRNNRPLRVILPLIFYHGKTEWKVKKRFADQFNVNEELKKYMLDYEYLFFDTRNFDFNLEVNKNAKDNVFLLSSLMLMKSAFNKNIESVINIFSFWKEKGFVNKKDDIIFFFTYLAATKEVKKEKLLKIIEENEIQGGDIMPTLAREWYNEGRQEGRQEGIIEGVKKGILKGLNRGKEEKERALVLRMFNQGMEISDITKFTGLSKDKIKEIVKEQ